MTDDFIKISNNRAIRIQLLEIASNNLHLEWQQKMHCGSEAISIFVEAPSADDIVEYADTLFEFVEKR